MVKDSNCRRAVEASNLTVRLHGWFAHALAGVRLRLLAECFRQALLCSAAGRRLRLLGGIAAGHPSFISRLRKRLRPQRNKPALAQLAFMFTLRCQSGDLRPCAPVCATLPIRTLTRWSRLGDMHRLLLPDFGGDWFRHGGSEVRSRSWSPRHVKQGYCQN